MLLGIARSDHAAVGECGRVRRRGNRRAAMIDGGAEIAIAARLLVVAALHLGRPDMMLIREGLLLRRGVRRAAAMAAIEAHMRDVDVVHDRAAIDIGDMRAAKVVHGGVVMEVAPVPEAAMEADAVIAEAIDDAAIEADARAPIAGTPEVDAVVPGPIAGG